MINYEEFLKLSQELTQRLDDTSEVLNKFPTGNCGLTPDDVKNSDEFKIAKCNYNVEFNKYRDFHGRKEFKKYKQQRSQERRQELIKQNRNKLLDNDQ